MSDILVDFFNSDYFKLSTLTAALLKRPIVPQFLGQSGLFEKKPLSTRTMSVEELNLAVGLLPYSDPNGPGTPVNYDKRKARPFTVPCVKMETEVWASDVANVRAFGTGDQLETVATKVMEVTDRARVNRIEPTLEFLRAKAIQGYVGDPSNPSSYLLDACTEMGVTRAAAVNFDLTQTTIATWLGYIETARQEVLQGLGGVPYTGLVAFCSQGFFAGLKANSIVQDQLKYAYMGQGSMAATLRNLGPNTTAEYLAATPAFEYQGITWVNYGLSLGQGDVGAVDFLPANEAVLVPTGVAANFMEFYSPANYAETVNTLGLPIYAKSELKKFGKGVDIELQSNPLIISLRPGAIVRLY